MAGTTAAAAKAAIIDALATAAAAASEGDGLHLVQVAYTYPGRSVQRKCVYGGKVAGSVELSAMRGSGRIKRVERLALELHIQVTEPGHDSTRDTDATAAAIGAAIEEYLAANPTLAGSVPDLKVASVVAIDLDGGIDDESAESVLSYSVALLAQLA